MAAAPATGTGPAVVGHIISMAPEPRAPSAPVVGFPLVAGAPAGSSNRAAGTASQPHHPARSHGGHGSGTPPNNVGDWIGGALGELSGLLGAAVGSAGGGGDDGLAGRLTLDAPPPAFPPADHPFWRRPDVADKVLYGVSQLHSERCLAVAAAEASSSSLRRLNASVEALQHALEAEQLRCADLEARCGETGTRTTPSSVPGSGASGHQAAGSNDTPASVAALASGPASVAGEVEALRERVQLLQALLADERTRGERTASLAADAAQAGGDAGASMLAAQLQAEKERSAGLEARLQGWLDSRTATSSEVERLNRALRERDAQAIEAAQRHARVEAQLRGEIEHVLRQGERRQDDLLTLEAVRHERASAQRAAQDASADVARLQQTLATLRAALKEEQSLRKDLELRLSWDGASGTGGVAAQRAGKSSPAPRLGDVDTAAGRHPSPAPPSASPDAGAASDKAAARLAAAEITRLQDLLAAERKKSVDVALGAARAVAAAKAAAAAGPTAPGAAAARPGAPRTGGADGQQGASSAALAAATAAASSATMRAEAAELQVADLQAQVQALLAQAQAHAQATSAAQQAAPAALAALSAEAAAAQMRAEAAAMEIGDLRVQVQALTAKLAGEQALGGSSVALRRAEARADGLADALAEAQAELARLKQQQQQGQLGLSQPASPSAASMPPSPLAPRPGGELLRSESSSSLDVASEPAGPRKSGTNSARKARMR
jgi:hypothetical protein